jgi:hypothetical protein
MLGAVYTHLVADIWPNDDAAEPPIALPIAVLLIASDVPSAWRPPRRRG